MARAFEARFGISAEDGARSGAFKIWAPKKKNEVYVAQRALGGSLKGTIHLEGVGASPRHFGFTTEAVAELNKRGAPLNRSRHLVEFPGLQVADGASIECRICIPRRGLAIAPPPEGSEKVTWLPAPPPGTMLNFFLMLAPADATIDWPDLRAAEMHKFVDGRLADGRQVSVIFSETSDEEITPAVNDLRAKLTNDGARLASENQHTHRTLLFDVHPKGYLMIADIAAREVMPISEDGSESLGLRGQRWPSPPDEA